MNRLFFGNFPTHLKIVAASERVLQQTTNDSNIYKSSKVKSS